MQVARRVFSFDDLVRKFIEEHSLKTVVEVGSDAQLNLAAAISPVCKKYYSLNFPKDCQDINNWYEHRTKEQGFKITLIPGTALDFSSRIPQADLILLYNVTLALDTHDRTLLANYQKLKPSPSPSMWKTLLDRFDEAETKAYQEFLRVAHCGYIIRFSQKPLEGNSLTNLLNAGIREGQITHQDTYPLGAVGTLYKAAIIDNTK